MPLFPALVVLLIQILHLNSDDLHWQIVWLRIARNMIPRKIADLLCIGESTVHCYIQRFYEIGSVSPTKYHHGPHT